jgi:O-antigen biosynthesis protein WbqP
MTLATPLAKQPQKCANERASGYLLKRPLDFALALLLLPVAVPLVLVLGLMVRLTSPGPALFRQVRVGRGGRPFACLKLRTMYQGTANLPSHAVGNSAVTRVGRVLRASKLDEVPQLWNILKGEMSFVGPRPCLPTQTALIEARRQLGLADLRPGMTGIAQIRGVDMRDPARLAALDANYVSEMSLWRDLVILLQTVCGGGRGDRTDAAK